MGSLSEGEAKLGNDTVPENMADTTVPASKAESIFMDLYIDPIKERKMMWKFDFCAIGMLGLFYMLANLDRLVQSIASRCVTHALKQ